MTKDDALLESGNIGLSMQFTSKVDVLKFLTKKIEKAKIEKFLDYSVLEWKEDSERILNEVKNEFKFEKIVVRSSAKGEDSEISSEAGKYDSILDVNASSNLDVISAINSVIMSYANKGNIDDANRIIIQKQTKNSEASGVIFSRTENIGAPYYTINYDLGSSTDGVTSGRVNNVIKIFRDLEITKIPKQFQKLIIAIKEIEGIFKTSFLDIEFGITNLDEIIIFQVRPLTNIKKINQKSDKKMVNLINNNKMKFDELMTSSHLHGNFTIFSDMADWNPAEIIGNNPNLLDYSLYDYLIMEETWHKGRTDIGYLDVSPSNLMVKFGNKPYVDVRASFNSLLPNNIENKLKQRLLNFYLNKLKENPYLHDKVEFEILFTCYDLNSSDRLKELEEFFSNDEIKKIENSLIDFTNDIIKKFNDVNDLAEKHLIMLNSKRSEISEYLNTTNKNYTDYLHASEKLLSDCKEYGAQIFSTMARIAFIANALLKSIKSKKKMKSNQMDLFMNSIRTPLSEIRDDFADYYKSKITKKDFIKKYGHLRPGTYDIISMRYDKDNPYFDNIKYLKSNYSKNKFVLEEIEEIFLDSPIQFNNSQFFDFSKKAISQREKLKFEFTKNLSDAIECIVEAGKLLGFTREDLSNLDINLIFNSYKTKNKNQLKSLWQEKIDVQKLEKNQMNLLVNPPLIKSKEDFEVISYFSAKPNFVTSKSISCELMNIEKIQEISLEDKIVLIENADPGFDWIFTKNPAGLVTKYGGVASHMSIRCAEIGLPAAIGCGEILYEKLLKTSKVLLDCENEQIIILEDELSDEEVEVRKTLKSIGYIK